MTVCCVGGSVGSYFVMSHDRMPTAVCHVYHHQLVSFTRLEYETGMVTTLVLPSDCMPIILWAWSRFHVTSELTQSPSTATHCRWTNRMASRLRTSIKLTATPIPWRVSEPWKPEHVSEAS